MKKSLSLFLGILFIVVLMGCERSLTDETDIPNGLEPIAPYRDCDVPILDDVWVCIWADEFDGTEVDETKWTCVIEGQGGGTNELP